MARKKKDVIKDIEDLEEVKTAKMETELQKTMENEKKEERKGEFRAFLTLLFIVVVLVGGVTIWYTKFYDKDHNKLFSSIFGNKYKVVNYKTDHELKMLGNKYILEYGENYLLKLFDINGDVLFDEETEFTDIYLGNDDNLYLMLTEYNDENSEIILYKFNNSTFEEVNKFGKLDTTYYPVLFNNGGETVLYGFVGEENGFDTELDAEVVQSTIKTLDGKEHQIKNGTLFKDADEIRYIFNKRYLIVNNVYSNKYGLYDLEEDKLIADYNYDYMAYGNDKEFIVQKNNKFGIINTNLKKLADYNYDEIKHFDNFYVVKKNNKLAIMDDKYQFVTKFDFDYQTNNKLLTYLADVDSYGAYKVGDNYILYTNAYENDIKSENVYNTHNAYFIKKDGTYEIVNENNIYYDQSRAFLYTYDLNNKDYTIYNKDLSVKFVIDIKNYDLPDYEELKLFNNTIIVGKDSKIYFDYDSGKELDNIKNFDYQIGNIRFNFNGLSRNFIIYENGNPAVNFKDENLDDDLLTNIKNNKFYYQTNEGFITLKR